MSRIGNLEIIVPEGVEVSFSGQDVTVKGPKGTLTQTFGDLITFEQDGNKIVVKRPDESKISKQMHGTTRSLLWNMIEGVKDGYKKELEIVGIGYRANLQGNTLVLEMGYSHDVEFEIEKGLEVEVPKNTQIIISGADKQQVGEFASKVRAVRPPEPYKGKGIHYKGEHVRRKEGKTAASA